MVLANKGFTAILKNVSNLLLSIVIPLTQDLLTLRLPSAGDPAINFL